MNFFIRTRIIFLLLACWSLIPVAASAQSSIRITLNKSNLTVKEALQIIESQSRLSVAYNESKINGSKEIALDITDRPLEEALAMALAGTGFTYRLKDGYIMIVAEQQEQPINITGTVSDKSGAPLAGASVVLKGTSKAAMADVNGHFALNGIEPGQALVVSFVGYDAREITVSAETSYYSIALDDAVSALDEVVVTALGIKRAEKALSYNVQTVNTSDVTTVKSANLINSLSGKVAGVTINAGSAGVGGATKVIMRGSKSITASNNALYVIDGIPMYNNIGAGDGSRENPFGSVGTTEAIADINPEDIESISVLTGAAAAALYGNQGAGGAIIITTKKGVAGKLEVAFSSNTEILSPLVMPRFQNRYGTGDLASEAGSTIRSWGHELTSENSYGYTPQKDFFETGTVFTNAVSVSTGTEKNQAYFSVAAVNSDGIIPNNQYDRYNFSFRNTSKFLSDKMSLDVGGSYIIQQDQNMVNNGIYFNPIPAAYLFPRGDDFDMARVFERYDPSRSINAQYWPQGEGSLQLQNPYWAAYRNLRNNDRKRYMMNAGLSYDVLSWLNLAGRVRIDNTHNDYTEKRYATTDGTFAGPNGYYEINRSYDRQVYADALANINKRFNDFTVQVNVGASISDTKRDALTVNGDIRSDGIPNVFNVLQLDRDKKKEIQDGWRTQSQAVFASAEVGYKSAYYLTLTGRNDWESALANTEQLSFFYPSVGLSTVLSQILPLPRQIEYLKARASFTKVGTPIPRNISMSTYAWDINAWSGWKTQSIYPIRVFKPESTASWELGLTARFMERFSVDFSWYHTNTINQTFEPNISVSSGYSTMYIQTGNVRNTGVEVALGYNHSWSGILWSSSFILSANRNKIEELVTNFVHPETGELINKDEMLLGGLGYSYYILKPGGTLGDLYSTQDLKYDSNGKIYVDADGMIQTEVAADEIFLGSVFPKANLSWRNDLSWKGLNLGFMFSARIGGIVYSSTQAALDFHGVSEASAAARDNGGVPINGSDVINAQTWYTTIGADEGLPQYYTYSATNVRLQELSLGYTIPQKRLKDIAEVTLSLVGRNLWMIYCKAPFDPEAVASTGNYFQGIDHFMTPSLRSVGFNLKVKF